jgi:hypothetical protein
MLDVKFSIGNSDSLEPHTGKLHPGDACCSERYDRGKIAEKSKRFSLEAKVSLLRLESSGSNKAL